MSKTVFKNPMAAARAMTKYLTDRHQRFSARPFNPHRPEDTIWWVVPSSEWPAYRFGKYTFWKKDSSLWCGYNIEKGLALKAAEQYGKSTVSKMSLNADWQWHSFMADLGAGKIAAAMDQIKSAGQSPVHVIVSIGPIKNPEDHNPQGAGFEKAVFHYDNGDLVLAVNEIRSSELEGLTSVVSMSELFDWFLRTNLEWLWVDINIVVPMEIPRANGSFTDFWDEQGIFDNVLAPLERWVN